MAENNNLDSFIRYSDKYLRNFDKKLKTLAEDNNNIEEVKFRDSVSTTLQEFRKEIEAIRDSKTKSIDRQQSWAHSSSFVKSAK
ncbi:4372_t:CDS:2 [Diversispora eburnea]|uniref:4372_t:CDS:1 n=1 Tax=Diversispora eburnea TaxID=1213867 RepID=A0A9N8YME6_9GLOM|nr:4372_t:CDS:2 [Diversispora eburnea]